MPKLNFIIILIYSFPEALVLGWLSLSLIALRPSFKQVLKIGCLQTTFVTFLFLVVGKMISIPFGIHTVVQMATLMAIIHTIMKISYKSSALAVLLGFAAYIGIEALVVPLYTFITGEPLAIISGSNWWSRLPYFISKLMTNVLVILLLQRFNTHLLDIWDNMANKRFLWIAGLLSTQSLLIAFLCWKYFLQYREMFASAYFYFYFALVSIVVPIIAMIVVRQFIVLTKGEVESKIQLDNLHHIEELLNTMRIQRHDFTHELQVIYGLLEVEEFHEAREYLKKSVSQVAATSQLVKTDNLGVTALLYAKTGLAEARKINLDIKVETNLKKFPLEARDINLVLGNLIDNALEAVADLPIPERKVEVTIRQGLEGYTIEVKNYGSPISQDKIGKVFTPGFSTKGEGRGMGLYSVQKLVSKYNGKISVKSDNEETIFKVIISSDQSLSKPKKIKRNFFGGSKKWLG